MRVRMRGVAGVRGLLARGWRGCGSVRVSRWCMAAHAGNGGRPISRVSAGKRRAPHPAPDGVGRAVNMKQTSQYSIDRGPTIV